MEDYERERAHFDRKFGMVCGEIARMKWETNAILSRTLRRKFIQHLDFRIVDHCNLNCKCCSTCSPISEERFADPDTFERDLRRLHELVGDRVMQIHLLGGEPLLHPNTSEFARIARKEFPHARIDITTNGLLVKKMPESFWEDLRKYDIALKYTRYPISLDYDELEEYVIQRGVFVFRAREKEPISYFRRTPVNPKGTANAWKSYIQCTYVDCAQLRDGKLWHCPVAVHSDLWNRALEQEGLSGRFHATSLDYIDLYQETSGEAVMDFMSCAIPFCQYCEANLGSNIPWELSDRSITEWIDI